MSHLKLVASGPSLRDLLVTNLRRLMRDRGITEARLARETSVPQPTLHKILSGKTEDPRAATLKAVADFFHTSIDQLLTGNTGEVEYCSPSVPTQIVPIISWEACLDVPAFLKKLVASNQKDWIACGFIAEHAYALSAKPSMQSYFPKGTVLIIHPEITPFDGDIVVAHYPNTEEATLRKLSMDGPDKLLLPLGDNAGEGSVVKDARILGVVWQSIFSYHG